MDMASGGVLTVPPPVSESTDFAKFDILSKVLNLIYYKLGISKIADFGDFGSEAEYGYISFLRTPQKVLK